MMMVRSLATRCGNDDGDGGGGGSGDILMIADRNDLVKSSAFKYYPVPISLPCEQ